MAARTPEKILVSLESKKGKEIKMRSKLAANKERNWLLALMLHSFDKLDGNAPLSDLDQKIISAFRTNGFTDVEIKQQGRLYRNMSVQLRNEIFPAKFAQLTHQSMFTLENLKTESPKIVKAVLKMKNVANVDIQAVHAGNAHISEFLIPKSAAVTHAGTLVVATTLNTTPARKYTIKATKFHCSDETGTDFFGSDEPYWIFGSLGGGIPVTTRSKVFGDVDSGNNRDFDASEGCIWGQNCAAQALPDGDIGVLVSLIEHDSGDPKKIQAGFAAAFAAAAAVLAATGVASWIAAVLAGVGAILDFLLGFLDDDKIADQTLIFTRETVENLIKIGSSKLISQRFTDGDGDYTLTIRIARAA